MGGSEGGSSSVSTSADDVVASREKTEQDRKAKLRTRINQLYGIDDPDYTRGAAPKKEDFKSSGTGLPVLGKTYTPVVGKGSDEYEAYKQRLIDQGFNSVSAADVAAAQYGEPPATWDFGGAVDDTGYQAALDKWNAGTDVDPKAQAARDALKKEETDLSKSTRDFYTEDLEHTYKKAKRNNTFALADRGLLGGSAQIDTEGELNRDNTLGATRLEDEVKAAVAALKNTRETERLNATSLVNSGSGEDAVAGAQAGLTRALDNASATRKASIASDLFTTGADSVAAGNASSYGPLSLQAYRNSLKTFYNPTGGSAKVTSTGG